MGRCINPGSLCVNSWAVYQIAILEVRKQWKWPAISEKLVGATAPNPTKLKNSRPRGREFSQAARALLYTRFFIFYEQVYSFFMTYGGSCDIVNSLNEIFIPAVISLYDSSPQPSAITTGAVCAAVIAQKNLIFAS